MKGRADLSLAIVVLALGFACVVSQEEMTVTAAIITEEIERTTVAITEFSSENPSTFEACVYSEYSTVCECENSTTAGASVNTCGFSRNFTCNGEVVHVENAYNLTTADCLVQAEWSEWASWSTCNDSCSSGGWRNRSRTCDAPPATEPWKNVSPCNGTDLGESESESELCACGEWSEWGEYSTCSATCGGGLQLRQRDCVVVGNAPPGAGPVCNGSSNDTAACATDECPLSQDEKDNCIYVVLQTTMTIDEYYESLRPFLWPASIIAANTYCSNSSVFGICCPNKTPWSFVGVQEYVTRQTMYWPGGFSDGSTLYISLCMFPDIERNALCNAPAGSGRKKREVSFAAAVTSAVASSDTLTSSIQSSAAAAGVTVAVLPPVSTSVAAAKAASLATSTAATTAAAAAATVAPQPLGLIIGVSVGGGLGLLAIILITVVVVKKKMAKTGVAEITHAQHEHQHHEAERRHRELEEGNVAYATPQANVVAVASVQQQP